MPDRFPEAFRRFEEVVDVSSFKSYRELGNGFSQWAGKRWIDSRRQNLALKEEARRLGIMGEIPAYHKRPAVAWGRAVVSGKHRGLSAERISVIKSGISRGYSANQILRQLRSQKIGMRRQVLLRNVREIRMKSAKADVKKHIPKKYRLRRAL